MKADVLGNVFEETNAFDADSDVWQSIQIFSPKEEILMSNMVSGGRPETAVCFFLCMCEIFFFVCFFGLDSVFRVF